jgi:hypothetical protein
MDGASRAVLVTFACVIGYADRCLWPHGLRGLRPARRARYGAVTLSVVDAFAFAPSVSRMVMVMV